MCAKATEMDAVEIAEFMQSQQTGVLSMADGDDGYAIPVSFAYDETDDDGPYVYFRLGFAPGSEKRAFLDSTNLVSFVVYDETPEGWKSVVTRGRLETQSGRTLDAFIIEAIEGIDIPYFAVHEHSPRDLNFSLVRLDVTDLRGIVEG